MTNIHYIFDPMCGWCYGAASLIEQLSDIENVTLNLHPGGMIERSPLSDDFRKHVRQADQHIAQQTGAKFGDEYIAKITNGEPVILDSYITAQAILAAQSWGKAGIAMLKKIQQAHYQQGLPVAEQKTLLAFAQELGIEASHWEQAMLNAKAALEETINQTHGLMDKLNVAGFPSLAYEKNGQWHKVPVSSFYNKPQKWSEFWQQVITK